jgi:hypothetical protein
MARLKSKRTCSRSTVVPHVLLLRQETLPRVVTLRMTTEEKLKAL